ncbi:MAG: class I SAM-dependent methyltransferase [Spirochaetes bacterium]|nr:class I SAM-dependent methyltransferase [Spirochaetota bacterium]MBN2770706.1 class I SAM-dependent methyltransferase [Spirochaetota bacterium]
MSKNCSSILSEPGNAYTRLAEHYDYMLNHVDYVKWYTYIKTLMYLYYGYPETILEIGTGTGRFGGFFSRDNYNIIGMDLSLDMLRVARMRAFNNFRVFCGDARSFSLNTNIDFIFSVHDTFNYLLTGEELLAAFNCVANCMHAKSVFLFDLTTEYNIKENFVDDEQTFKHGGSVIVWKNRYDNREKVIRSIITFQNGKDYHCEEHLQRVYTKKEIVPILEESGLYLVDQFADYHFDPPTRKSIMENYIVKKRE